MNDGLGMFRDLYAGVIKFYEREMRPPFTIEHLTDTIGALSDGFALQHFSSSDHPRLRRDDRDDERIGDDWTLFASVLDLLVEQMTRPINDADTPR